MTVDPLVAEAIGDRFTLKNEGVVVTATTQHAWPEPRGEVYLTLDASQYFEAFGLEDLGEVEDNEVVAGLAPLEARALAQALLVLADHAETLPARTWDPNGHPVNDKES